MALNSKWSLEFFRSDSALQNSLGSSKIFKCSCCIWSLWFIWVEIIHFLENFPGEANGIYKQTFSIPKGLDSCSYKISINVQFLVRYRIAKFLTTSFDNIGFESERFAVWCCLQNDFLILSSVNNFNLNIYLQISHPSIEFFFFTLRASLRF